MVIEQSRRNSSEVGTEKSRAEKIKGIVVKKAKNKNANNMKKLVIII